MPTGYGQQTALILPRLRNMGHELAVTCTAGVDSHPTVWRDIPVFPKTPYCELGEDMVGPNAARWGADLVVTFYCLWTLRFPEVYRDLRTIHLLPVDTTPMSSADYAVLEHTGGLPAAISRHGETQMRARGLDPLYLPHGVDLSVFRPPADRDTLRKSYGFDGKFVVGMNFMNNDKFRKNLDASIRGFAEFHREHPDSLLAMHAIQALPEGLNLPALCQHLGISKAVRWSVQEDLLSGFIGPEVLADWYGACDVVVNIGNEGFGLPAVEAQGCGTPVILGDWSTGPELVGPGWLVSGQPWWNDKHRADWGWAHLPSVTDALEQAYEGAAKRRGDSRYHALGWDINRVVRDHWGKILEDLS